MTYRILDLFSGAGGAAEGYRRAGFEVVGVDIAPQPRYSFSHIQADAVQILTELIEDRPIVLYGDDEIFPIDAIHASPPCQSYSATRTLPGRQIDKYPMLIAPVRKLLERTGLPYVIENVEQARWDMNDPVKLCGSSFGLTAQWRDQTVYLQRHRLFESNFPIPALKCDHSIGVKAVTVAGHGRMGVRQDYVDFFAGKGYEALKRAVMGIDWMNRDELNESIPPAYTEYVGKCLMQALSTSNQEAA